MLSGGLDISAANLWYDVFLCHNSRDKAAVKQLAKLLTGRGIRVWLDEWALLPGRRFRPEIEKMIESGEALGCVVVLVGRDGIGRWQDLEIDMILEQALGRKMLVIPVFLLGAPTQPDLPASLRSFTWVDFRGGYTDEALDRLTSERKRI